MMRQGLATLSVLMISICAHSDTGSDFQRCLIGGAPQDEVVLAFEEASLARPSDVKIQIEVATA